MVILDIDGQKYAGNSYIPGEIESAASYALGVERLAEEVAETVLLHYGLTARHIRIESKEIEYAIVGEEFVDEYPPSIHERGITLTPQEIEQLEKELNND